METARQERVAGWGWSDPGLLMIVASAAGFGSLAIFGKLAYAGGLNVPTLLAVRFSLAALLLWGLLVAARISPHISLRRLGGLLVMGVLYVAQAFAFFTALETVPAATTGLLLYLYPALVTLLAWLLLGQRIRRSGLVALGMASLGCVLVLGGLEAMPGQDADSVGIAWSLAAASIYSTYIIAGSRITAGIHPLVASTYIISVAALVFTAAGLFGGALYLSVTPAGWAAAAAIALFGTVIAIACFFAGMARLGPARASILSTVEPAITIALAALVLGEKTGAIQLLGGALILTAAVVVSRKPPAVRQPTTTS